MISQNMPSADGQGTQEKKKHKGSLMVQAAVLFWCALVLIMVTNNVIMYRSSMQQAIQDAEQTVLHYAHDGAETLGLDPFLGCAIQYFEEHPDELEALKEADPEALQEARARLEKRFGAEWEYILTQSDVDAMTQPELAALALHTYGLLEDLVKYYQGISTDMMEGPVIVGSLPGESPRVLSSASDSFYHAPGEVLSVSGDDLKKIQSLEADSKTAPDLEMAKIRVPAGRNGEVFTGIAAPVNIVGSDYKAYVIMAVDEAYLKGRNMGRIFRIIVVDLLISLLLGVVLLQLLYYMILKPVTRIQKGLHTYVKNGDTDEVVHTMDRVRANNEIGRLAGDIGNMVQTIAAHVSARQQLEDEQEKLAAELANAAMIQRAMLPKVFPDRSSDPRLDLYASMEPAKEVGGDLYDFFLIDPDNLALVIADVSGKGIPAALFMMEAKTLIRERTVIGIHLEEVLKRVNERLCAFNEEKQFITTWMMILNFPTGKAWEVNAGHTRPVLCRSGGRYEQVWNIHDMPLGIVDDQTFTVNEWQLKAGDRIFVYTDGITEAENGKQEQFGAKRMLAALNEKRDAAQKETLAYVTKQVRAFLGEAPQTDDMTMLGMTYFGPG